MDKLGVLSMSSVSSFRLHRSSVSKGLPGIARSPCQTCCLSDCAVAGLRSRCRSKACASKCRVLSARVEPVQCAFCWSDGQRTPRWLALKRHTFAAKAVDSEDGSDGGDVDRQGSQCASAASTSGSMLVTEGPEEDAERSSPRVENVISRMMYNICKTDWSWLCFGISEKEKVWAVPWTGHTIFQVMFLWFLAFWVVGSWVIPMGAHTLGYSRAAMSSRAQALYSLVTDVAEMTVGLGILHRCLSRFYPLPAEWFPIRWRGYWCLEVFLGVLFFPVVNLLSQVNLDLLPVPVPFPAASQLEQSLSARDPVATLLYIVVVSICAPIWEEIIFRGFLLPSLTRYLPIWAAVIVSALAFAVAHFSLQRLLPLSFLGIVMGVVFVRSRNLLASMLLHSLWNGFVFLELLR